MVKARRGEGWVGGWDTFLLFMRATHAMEPTLGENIFEFSVKINTQTMAHQTCKLIHCKSFVKLENF